MLLVEISGVLPVEISTKKIRSNLNFHWKQIKSFGPSVDVLMTKAPPPLRPVLDRASLIR